MFRKHAGTVVLAVFILVAATLAVGHLVGQPVLVSFVTSDSMSPTLEAGDGFVAVPQAVSGDVSEGDVVVFEAEEVGGGGLTTHRVVGETDGGYVTKGDANPFTDQDGGEPPVTDEQIAATALQVKGWVVTIPQLGTGIGLVRDALLVALTALGTLFGVESAGNPVTVGLTLVLAGVGLFAVSLVTGRGRTAARQRSRSRSSDGLGRRHVALFLIAVVLLPANAVMLSAADEHRLVAEGIEGADDQLEGEIAASNGGLVTMVVVFEPADPQLEMDQTALALGSGASDSTTLSAPTPPPGETREYAVAEHRYLGILPPTVLLALHDVHPLLALGTVNLLLLGSIVAVTGGLFGVEKRRRRSRDLPLRTRLTRLLREIV